MTIENVFLKGLSFDEALKARPDLLSLARQVEAQELTTRSIRGGYAPSLNASASLNDGMAA